MSGTILDESLLNDNDDDLNLDYEIDPSEENALLDEDEDEDVLDLSYDQMGVGNDASFSTPKEEKKEEVEEKHPSSQELEKNITTNVTRKKPDKLSPKYQRYPPRGGKRRPPGAGTMRRRGNTLLINARFRGPVQVTSKLAWDTPPASMLEAQKPQQYVQPWINGVVPNQAMTPHIPFNPAFNTYMPQQPQPELHQPFAAPQQIFVNQSHPAIQQSMMMNQQLFSNQYQQQPSPQIPFVQQVPAPTVPQKLPVHQRLGVPMNAANTQPDISNQPYQNSFQYGNLQNVHTNNQFQGENRNYDQFSHSNQQMNSQQIHMNNRYVYSEQQGYDVNHMQNEEFSIKHLNNNLATPRKQQFDGKRRKNFQQNRNINQVDEVKSPETTLKTVIPEGENEEDRKYRLMIEDQKKKRQEVLRKKEENRMKTLGLQKEEPKPISHIVTSSTIGPQNFQQRKFKKRVPPQKLLQVGNNIVITGNDNDSHYTPRQNVRKVTPVFNNRDPTRIVLSSSATEEATATDVSSFLSNRAVLPPDDLMRTNIVVVKNLSTTTTEKKIMSLCQEVGPIQKLQMEKKEHRAFIHFNTVPTAHAFYKKFRRYMIDLSMVQVDLVPCESH